VIAFAAALAMALIGCGSPPQEAGESALAAANSAGPDKLREVRERVMDESRFEFAHLANALGYGWAGGCYGGVGDDMRREDGAKDAAGRPVIRWISNYDGSGSCGSGDQHRRLKISYAFREYLKIIPDLDNLKVEENVPEELSTQNIGWWPAEGKLIINRTYTFTDSYTATKSDTFSHSTSLTATYGGELSPFGAEFNLTLGGEHSTTKEDKNEVQKQQATTLELPIPADHCVISRVLVMRTKKTLPYTADLEIDADVSLEGFMRASASGGNFHREYRGKGHRPDVTDTFGAADRASFYDDVRGRLNAGAWPWNWTEMMANKDDFDHGAVVNWAMESLESKFRTKTLNHAQITGQMTSIEGRDITIDAKAYPKDSPECQTISKRSGPNQI
jgi:hypothetical protein